MSRVAVIRDQVDVPGLGGRVREARLQAGLSQRQLSFPGCTAAYISRVEKGERTPSLQILHVLADRLEVARSWLAGIEQPTPAEEIEQLRREMHKLRDGLEQLVERVNKLAASQAGS